mgnify:CR=1 FL=1
MMQGLKNYNNEMSKISTMSTTSSTVSSLNTEISKVLNGSVFSHASIGT